MQRLLCTILFAICIIPSSLSQNSSSSVSCLKLKKECIRCHPAYGRIKFEQCSCPNNVTDVNVQCVSVGFRGYCLQMDPNKPCNIQRSYENIQIASTLPNPTEVIPLNSKEEESNAEKRAGESPACPPSNLTITNIILLVLNFLFAISIMIVLWIKFRKRTSIPKVEDVIHYHDVGSDKESVNCQQKENIYSEVVEKNYVNDEAFKNLKEELQYCEVLP
ncbi:uncharacterized protein LOC132192710 [Neocloeon triangulifer]|uniref:uncharacterized protein LOC132192710 n=1 Tax=Neocloeon triangulifer TaxID=2078957 RepID=UPI00286EFC64|nr:uncharacterized protein LOC132192710 [Neocloeon triangulifer]